MAKKRNPLYRTKKQMLDGYIRPALNEWFNSKEWKAAVAKADREVFIDFSRQAKEHHGKNANQ